MTFLLSFLRMLGLFLLNLCLLLGLQDSVESNLSPRLLTGQKKNQVWERSWEEVKVRKQGDDGEAATFTPFPDRTPSSKGSAGDDITVSLSIFSLRVVNSTSHTNSFKNTFGGPLLAKEKTRLLSLRSQGISGLFSLRFFFKEN